MTEAEASELQQLRALVEWHSKRRAELAELLADPVAVADHLAFLRHRQAIEGAGARLTWNGPPGARARTAKVPAPVAR